jgi:hypothetical protein
VIGALGEVAATATTSGSQPPSRDLVRLATAVLAEALDREALRELPTTPEALLFFVSGPLYEATHAAFGSAAADRMLLELAPVLDEVWAADRSELAADLDEDAIFDELSGVGASSMTRERMSRFRCAEEIVPSDTVPAAATEPCERTSHPVASHVPTSGVHERCNTQPYLAAALDAEEHHAEAVVVIIDADNEARSACAALLRAHGYLVATTSNRLGARALIARLDPALVIADRETIAPDYEPIGQAIDELLGLSEREAAEAPEVLLLVTEELRERAPAVGLVLAKAGQASGHASLSDAPRSDAPAGASRLPEGPIDAHGVLAGVAQLLAKP